MIGNLKDNDFKTMKDSKKLFKSLGFIGIGLCAACCLLPIVAMLFGVGALTFLTGFLEWAGIIAMTVAVIFFSIYFVRSRKAPACDVDCACKDERDVSTMKR